jgi:tetratricopeptide (TPR) repeat protein
MISSTARDLPDHRKEVLEACLRMGMFPDMMEHLPASDADAIRISMEMVDRADIYLGVFAFRYGTVPKTNNPQQISITEMEYNRAGQRGIPRLIFIMDRSHPITAADMDEDTKDPIEVAQRKVKLEELKKRAAQDQVPNFFKSPVELRAQVIQALVPYREADITQFHYVSDIPAPPEAYIAHPYTLLQTHRLIGRQAELNLLTDWVTSAGKGEAFFDSSSVEKCFAPTTRIMNIVAIGGMGKSALTWKWFNDIAPQEIKPLAGRMWWSFYESDASFENFVIRALAYVTRQSREEAQKISPPEREAQLLAALDREPFLIVLDGLERILLAYARMDAARLADDDIDQRTANYVAKAYGLPESAAQSFVGQHLLRKTADPRAGSFLRKLANVRAARILVSTRLYPADLQTATGEPMNGSSAVFLRGLNDDDALNLWRAFNVSGSRETLLPMFHKFENHPLLIQSLASEVGNYRRAPGDFERWQKDHPNFNPFNLSMVNARAHVLEFALRGLDDKARKVLETIAAFRMPASYDTLAALFVGEGKLFSAELGLDVALKELEDRGLVGWDKRANRYDLHPIVRGVVWSGLPDDTRNGVFTTLYTHFESLPTVNNTDVENLDDLTVIIELYNSLLGLRKNDEAWAMLHGFEKLLINRLGAARQLTELLELLLPFGLDRPPALSSVKARASVLSVLAVSYHLSGQLDKAALAYRSAINLSVEDDDKPGISAITVFSMEVDYLRGHLCKTEIILRQEILIERELDLDAKLWEGIVQNHLGLLLASRGELADSVIALNRALHLHTLGNNTAELCRCISKLAQVEAWQHNFEVANELADRAWHLANVTHTERNLIRAARLQGAAALGLSNFAKADERLHLALTRARAVNLVEEELQALVALAELRRRQEDLKAARELLDDVWEPAERGPYPLDHADAFDVLAQIERDVGNHAAAVDAATKAYRLAWCDGEPYAYHWGLVAARKHLRELGASEPSMPPFDESKYEPMPEVEINPNDEFHVDV